MNKKWRKGYIAVLSIAYEGLVIGDGTRVYFTRVAAQREADKITKSARGSEDHGDVIEVKVPR